MSRLSACGRGAETQQGDRHGVTWRARWLVGIKLPGTEDWASDFASTASDAERRSASLATSTNNPADDFYDAAPLEPHLLYQGEILVDVPLLHMPKESRWQLLRTRSGRRFEEALEHGNLGGLVFVVDSNKSREEWYAFPDGDFVAARLSKRPALVLSQTCDVQVKDFIQVAPIFDADTDDVERLRGGEELYSAFYLAPHPPHFGHSYADLELMQAVHKSYIKRLKSEQHFRLKEARTRTLQRALTRYFGRPNSYDVGADTAPEAGTYLCVACFYKNGIVTAVERAAGQEFHYCTTCGGRGWVKRGR